MKQRKWGLMLGKRGFCLLRIRDLIMSLDCCRGPWNSVYENRPAHTFYLWDCLYTLTHTHTHIHILYIIIFISNSVYVYNIIIISLNHRFELKILD